MRPIFDAYRNKIVELILFYNYDCHRSWYSCLFYLLVKDLSSFDIFPIKYVKNMVFTIKVKDIQQLKGQT